MINKTKLLKHIEKEFNIKVHSDSEIYLLSKELEKKV